MTENEAKKLINVFAAYEMVEYDLIFQNVLYFLGNKNTDINEDLTNKLNWKKARNYWTNDTLNLIYKYNPFGPKTAAVSSFAMINRLINVFKGIDVDKVKEYSIILGKLLEIMNCCKLFWS